jgi:phosphoglycolate phosphatase
MNITTNKRLVLFDLDGVLLHSHENMRQAWEVVLAKTDVDRPFEDYFAQIGRPFKDIMHRLGVSSDVERIEKVYMTASFEFLANATFFPGVRESLAEIRDLGVKMGVVTSKDAPRTKAVLAQLDISFASVQSPNGRFRGKPAPDHLLVAMAEAGEDPADTLFVGDMETDWQAACRAGIDYVHAGWGYGEPLPSIPTLESISQLPLFIQ